MLTKLKVFSAWQHAPILAFSENGRPETDLIQIRNIDGLNPVKAAINTASFGSLDGVAYLGGNVTTGRNIVLTLRPNPDWEDWTYEGLRRLIYLYFMPKAATKLVFYSNDIPPVEIDGYVESVEINQFSKDNEYQVSIICPDPYFKAVDPTLVTGVTADQIGGTVFPKTVHNYPGNIETGFELQITRKTDPIASSFNIFIGDPDLTYFRFSGVPVDTQKYVKMSSLLGNKYLQQVYLASGGIVNMLSSVADGSTWPSLKPGSNDIWITSATNPGGQDWQLTYHARYGAL